MISHFVIFDNYVKCDLVRSGSNSMMIEVDEKILNVEAWTLSHSIEYNNIFHEASSTHMSTLYALMTYSA
jgi:hypothetical protein